MKYSLSIILILLVCTLHSQLDSASHYFKLGQQAFTEKKYMVAEKNYTKCLQFDTKNTNALKDLALTYLEMKKYGFAITQFKNLIALDPNNAIALEKLAVLSFNNKMWEDAIKYCTICVEKKIGTNHNFRIAKSYYNQEEFIKSSKYLEAASKEEPNNAEIPYTMAQIWNEMSQSAKAIAMYEVALTKDTTNAMWYYELADMYNQNSNFKAALPMYEKALAKGLSNDLDIKRTIGLTYIQNAQYEKGLEYLNKVVERKPMDKTLYNDMAYAFYGQKKYDDAIKWWDEILRIDKQDAKALYMIGIAFQKNGNKDKGTKLCDAAIALEPALEGLRRKNMSPQGMGL